MCHRGMAIFYRILAPQVWSQEEWYRILDKGRSCGVHKDMQRRSSSLCNSQCHGYLLSKRTIPVCSCPILPQHVAQMYFSVIVAAYSLRCLPKTVCHNVFGISSEPVGWCLRLWTVFVQCMAGILRFFSFYYGFVVPACIALSGIIGRYKSLHMFGHNIYNRSVMENSIIAYVWT